MVSNAQVEHSAAPVLLTAFVLASPNHNRFLCWSVIKNCIDRQSTLELLGTHLLTGYLGWNMPRYRLGRRWCPSSLDIMKLVRALVSRPTPPTSQKWYAGLESPERELPYLYQSWHKMLRLIVTSNHIASQCAGL